MTKQSKDIQKAAFEAQAGKIAKAMLDLVKNAKRFPDVLDDASLGKLDRFLRTRSNAMLTELVSVRNAAAASFSLDENDDEPPAYVKSQKTVPATREETFAPLKPSVPQGDDDLDETIAALEEQPFQPMGRAPATAAPAYEIAPVQHDPLARPEKWVKPTGRLVGTKEPVWVRTAEGSDPDMPGEKPDRTGYIKEAGFLDAD